MPARKRLNHSKLPPVPQGPVQIDSTLYRFLQLIAQGIAQDLQLKGLESQSSLKTAKPSRERDPRSQNNDEWRTEN